MTTKSKSKTTDKIKFHLIYLKARTQNHVYDYNQSNLDQESNLKIENIYEQNEGSVVNNEEMRYVDQRDN